MVGAMRRAAWVPVIAIVAAARAPAQQLPLVPGDRVRVSWDVLLPKTAEGRLEAATADSIVFATDSGERRAVPMRSVERVEVARGFRSRTGEYAVGGGLLGGVVGALLAEAIVKHQNSVRSDAFNFQGSVRTGRIAGGFLGVVAGVAAGAFLGSRDRSIRWERVR